MPFSSSARSAGRTGSPPAIASSVVAQNTRPTTDASWSVRFSDSGSASMRAAISARTLCGIAAASSARRALEPAAATWRTISSAKNGLPSAGARTRSRSSLPASGSRL
jgi:hypothetical protein